jgi:flagellar biosynthetic protein FliP
VKANGARAKNLAALRMAKRVFLLSLLLVVFFSTVITVTASAQDFTVNVTAGEDAGELGPVEIIFIFAFLALLPSIILMMTSFTRIIVFLGFLRTAIGTAQSPPNMVLVGLAIFLSLFIMTPVFTAMNEQALQPYLDGDLDTAEALAAAAVPMKTFMIQNTNEDSLALFLDISGVEVPQVEDPQNPVELLELPITVIAPAFLTSELSRAFMMGFFIYLPFLVLDMVVSSILMSMGMVMLPPATISLPFKILLFVLIDGWNLTIGTLVNSFEVFA